MQISVDIFYVSIICKTRQRNVKILEAYYGIERS